MVKAYKFHLVCDICGAEAEITGDGQFNENDHGWFMGIELDLCENCRFSVEGVKKKNVLEGLINTINQVSELKIFEAKDNGQI